MMKLSHQQCCGSGMFIPDPEFRLRIFSIPDPGSEFFPSLIRINKFKYLNPKYCLRALGNMIRVVHPWSGYFTLPGSLIQGAKRHRIPDPETCSAAVSEKWKFALFPSLLLSQSSTSMSDESESLASPLDSSPELFLAPALPPSSFSLPLSFSLSPSPSSLHMDDNTVKITPINLRPIYRYSWKYVLEWIRIRATWNSNTAGKIYLDPKLSESQLFDFLILHGFRSMLTRKVS